MGTRAFDGTHNRPPKWTGPWTPEQQRAARENVLEGCALIVRHAAEVSYTEGPQRWAGIAGHRRVIEGGYPASGDCSSIATWLMWNALTHVFRDVPDIVNGQGWKAGSTRSIGEHGTAIPLGGQLAAGDLILYGSPPDYDHVTVFTSGRTCLSHGGPVGHPPHTCDIDYHGDRQPARRFIG